jgi:hypothetical protein
VGVSWWPAYVAWANAVRSTHPVPDIDGVGLDLMSQLLVGGLQGVVRLPQLMMRDQHMTSVEASPHSTRPTALNRLTLTSTSDSMSFLRSSSFARMSSWT